MVVVFYKILRLMKNVTNNYRKQIRLLLILVLLLLTLVLTACDYEYSLYHENIRDETEVQKIELITYYATIEEEKTNDGAIKLDLLDVIDTLNELDKDNFLDELSQIGGLSGKEKRVMDSPEGQGIKITYLDEGFTIITVTQVSGIDSIFVGHYDSDANSEYFYGISWQEMIDDFIELIENNFEYTITIN